MAQGRGPMNHDQGNPSSLRHNIELDAVYGFDFFSGSGLHSCSSGLNLVALEQFLELVEFLLLALLDIAAHYAFQQLGGAFGLKTLAKVCAQPYTIRWSKRGFPKPFSPSPSWHA